MTANGAGAGRVMLLVAHTGRPAALRVASVLIRQLTAAGSGVRVLEPEAAELNCATAAVVPASAAASVLAPAPAAARSVCNAVQASITTGSVVFSTMCRENSEASPSVDRPGPRARIVIFCSSASRRPPSAAVSSTIAASVLDPPNTQPLGLSAVKRFTSAGSGS